MATIVMYALFDDSIINAGTQKVNEQHFYDLCMDGLTTLFATEEEALDAIKEQGLIEETFLIPVTFELDCTRKISLEVKRMPLGLEY